MDGRPVDRTAPSLLSTATTIHNHKEGLFAMTKAQQTYERIEALVASGTGRPQAIKQLAAEYGQSVDSVRGAYYTGRKQASGETTAPRSTRPRKQRETTEQDAVGWAVTTLENAIGAIETEVDEARVRAEEAQREYDALSTAAPKRIEVIRAKIAVLADAEEAG